MENASRSCTLRAHPGSVKNITLPGQTHFTSKGIGLTVFSLDRKCSICEAYWSVADPYCGRVKTAKHQQQKTSSLTCNNTASLKREEMYKETNTHTHGYLYTVGFKKKKIVRHGVNASAYSHSHQDMQITHHRGVKSIPLFTKTHAYFRAHKCTFILR